MPELPEVETVARDLERMVRGKRIVSARVLRERNISTPDAPTFASAILDRAILGVRRRAKWIIVDLEGDVALLVHLRMTGQLLLLPASASLDPYVRVTLALDDGRDLRFRDVRAFGRLALVACGDDGIPASSLDPSDPPYLADHGPEPLEPSFTVDVLWAILSQRAGRLKGTLLDQRCIAGLGNIYVDESLWRARLHPLASGAALRRDEAARLHRAIVEVLGEAVEARGSSIDDYTGPDGDGSMQERLAVYQRQGEPCLACGATIRRLIVGGRATHICGMCQPLPRGTRRAKGELPRGALASDGGGSRRGGRWSQRLQPSTLGATVAERAAARRRAARHGGTETDAVGR